MDAATIVGLGLFALNVVLGLLGYLMKDKLNKMESGLEDTKKNLKHVEIHYAQKSDMEAIKTEILGRFDRLEDKLSDRLK
jgi:hypothetical protein